MSHASPGRRRGAPTLRGSPTRTITSIRGSASGARTITRSDGSVEVRSASGVTTNFQSQAAADEAQTAEAARLKTAEEQTRQAPQELQAPVRTGVSGREFFPSTPQPSALNRFRNFFAPQEAQRTPSVIQASERSQTISGSLIGFAERTERAPPLPGFGAQLRRTGLGFAGIGAAGLGTVISPFESIIRQPKETITGIGRAIISPVATFKQARESISLAGQRAPLTTTTRVISSFAPLPVPKLFRRGASLSTLETAIIQKGDVGIASVKGSGQLFVKPLFGRQAKTPVGTFTVKASETFFPGRTETRTVGFGGLEVSARGRTRTFRTASEFERLTPDGVIGNLNLKLTGTFFPRRQIKLQGGAKELVTEPFVTGAEIRQRTVVESAARRKGLFRDVSRSVGIEKRVEVITPSGAFARGNLRLGQVFGGKRFQRTVLPRETSGLSFRARFNILTGRARRFRPAPAPSRKEEGLILQPLAAVGKPVDISTVPGAGGLIVRPSPEFGAQKFKEVSLPAGASFTAIGKGGLSEAAKLVSPRLLIQTKGVLPPIGLFSSATFLKGLSGQSLGSRVRQQPLSILRQQGITSPISKQVPAQQLKPLSDLGTTQILRQLSKQVSAQQQITAQQAPRISFISLPALPIPQFFGSPRFQIPGGVQAPLFPKFSFGVRQPRRLTPSVRAISFGLRGITGAGGVRTGLGERFISTPSSKKKKRKRS